VIVGSITFLRPYFSEKKEASSLEELKSVDESQLKKITAKEIFQMISNQVNLHIIDLRNPDDFAKEHIIGSVNPNDQELADILAEIDKKQVYIFVEESGSQVGKLIIKNLGYPNHILYLDGGFDSWKSPGYPTISFGDPGSFSDHSKVKYLSLDEFKKLKDSGDSFILIDLRDKEFYNKEKIEGSANFPLGELETRRMEIPSGKTLVIFGNNNLDSFQGAVRLFDLGFFNVRTFKEGFSELKSSGL
jgi:rhodanese-related sulfurtransferase